VSGLAYAWPAPFAALKPGIVPGLGVIMFGMGMTLTLGDFQRVLRRPGAVALGVAAQYVIMPGLAWALARIFGLSPELSMGLIVVGCCPGGTASNVIAFLARADVALSVTLTACSTLLAVVMTPALIWLLGGQYLPVQPGSLLLDVVKIVLIPVGSGLLVNALFQRRVARMADVLPAISVLIIVLVIATIVALSRDKLPGVIGVVGLAVILHNVLGMGIGYGLATAFRMPLAVRRTIAIEVGMQNSGLAVALASAHFGALAALPASLFSVVHNLTGSVVAAVWRRTGAASNRGSV
jgi:BASS family bile acid:Na+ symporter